MNAFRHELNVQFQHGLGLRRLMLVVEDRTNAQDSIVRLLSGLDDQAIIDAAWTLPQCDHPWAVRERIASAEGQLGAGIHWTFRHNLKAARHLAGLLMLLL